MQALLSSILLSRSEHSGQPMLLQAAMRAAAYAVPNFDAFAVGVLRVHCEQMSERALPRPRTGTQSDAVSATRSSGDEDSEEQVAASEDGADDLCAGMAQLDMQAGQRGGVQAQSVAARVHDPSLASADAQLTAFFVVLQSSTMAQLCKLDRAYATKRRALAAADAAAAANGNQDASGLAGVAAGGAADVDEQQVWFRSYLSVDTSSTKKLVDWLGRATSAG